MSEEKPVFAKLPKSPAARMKILRQFLDSWGVKLKPVKRAKAWASAKKRVGNLPAWLLEFYESGIFDWCQKVAKGRPEWYFRHRWQSLDELQVDEEHSVIPLLKHYFDVEGISVEHRRLSDPPITSWFGLHPQKNDKPTSRILDVTLSEFIMRECFVYVLCTQPDRASHEEEGNFKPEYPLLVKAEETLTAVPFDPNRTGSEYYYEGPGVLFRKRHYSGDHKSIELQIAAKNKATLQSFLETDGPKIPGPPAKTIFWESNPTKAALKKANAGFPVERFKAKSGDISAEIRETGDGFARVEWSFGIQFGNVKVGERKYNCGLSADRILWDLKDWRQLDGRVVAGDDMLSAPKVHFYSGIWDTATRFEFRLAQHKGKKFKVAGKFELYKVFPDYPTVVIPFEAMINFTRIWLLYDNFKKKKMTTKRRDDLLNSLFDEKAFRVKHSKGSTELTAKT